MRAWLSIMLAVTGCSRTSDTAASPSPARPKLRWADPRATMIEVGGKLEVPAGAARQVAFISTTPCAEVAHPEIVTQLEVLAPPSAEFYLKLWRPRGTTAFLCAAAIAADGTFMAVG